jgi:hypothetical protein
MFRFDIALLILLLPLCGLARGVEAATPEEEGAAVEEIAWSDLPDSPAEPRAIVLTPRRLAEVLVPASYCERWCDSAFMGRASYNEQGQWLDYF